MASKVMGSRGGDLSSLALFLHHVLLMSCSVGSARMLLFMLCFFCSVG
jgi:hypothetical protein